MPTVLSFRRAGPAAALAALVLAACAQPAPPPPAPPPPPPAPPAVTLAPKLVEEAAAYRRYMTRAAAITPDFADGQQVAERLAIGVAYEPGQLVRGAIAYGAIVALTDPAYVQGVRAFAKDPVTRQHVAYELMKDPAYAVGLPDSAGAAGLVIAALGSDAQQLYDEGKAIKQSAYDIQKSAWSKAEVVGRDLRLSRTKDLSSAAMTGDTAEVARLQQAASGAGALGVAATPAAPPYTPTVVRALAVAALAALGEAGEENIQQVMAIASERNISTCMNMSKLNLYQCLAVARPNYEDVFCLGQHAMMDTGRCVIRAAGLPEPFEAKFTPSQESIDRGYKPKPTPKKKPKARARKR
jgi:hypothetical protein